MARCGAWRTGGATFAAKEDARTCPVVQLGTLHYAQVNGSGAAESEAT